MVLTTRKPASSRANPPISPSTSDRPWTSPASGWSPLAKTIHCLHVHPGGFQRLPDAAGAGFGIGQAAGRSWI